MAEPLLREQSVSVPGTLPCREVCSLSLWRHMLAEGNGFMVPRKPMARAECPSVVLPCPRHTHITVTECLQTHVLINNADCPSHREHVGGGGGGAASPLRRETLGLFPHGWPCPPQCLLGRPPPGQPVRWPVPAVTGHVSLSPWAPLCASLRTAGHHRASHHRQGAGPGTEARGD